MLLPTVVATLATLRSVTLASLLSATVPILSYATLLSAN